MNSEPTGTNPRLPILVLIGGLTVAFIAHGIQLAAFWDQINDDAFITFRYSLNLASGLGPYFNLGEFVEGYTNPLLMLLCAGWIAVAGPASVPLFAKLVGVVSSFSMVALAATGAWMLLGTTSALTRVMAAVLASGIVACTPYVAVNATTGLETTLTGALATLAVLLMVRTAQTGVWLGGGVVWGAAMWCRPEVPLPLAIAWIALAALSVGGFFPQARRVVQWSGRKLLARAMLIDGFVATALLGLLFVLRYCLYEGELLPNTYFAKVGGYENTPLGTYLWFGLVRPLLGVAGIAGGMLGLAFVIRGNPAVLACAASGLVGALLPIVTGTDWMVGYRLIVPYLALVAIVMGVG